MRKLGCLLLGILCLMGIVPLRSTFADPAAMYRGGSGHSGYSPETLSLPVSLLWRHTTEASPLSRVSPVFANGIIYFSAGQHVYAINATNGETVWRYPNADASTTDTKFVSTPTVDQGAVYVGSDAGDMDKIDAQSGQLIWSKNVGGTIQGAPTVDGGTIYFGCSDYHCYAKDTTTGATLWSFPTNGLVSSPPDVGEQNVYFTSGDDSVYCLAKTTGRKVWSLAFSTDPSISPPVYADNVLYIVSSNVLYAVNAHSGETLWTISVSGGITTTPTVGPNFVGVAALDGTFSAYTHQGRLRWRDNLGNPSYGAPLLTDTLLLVPDQRGVVYALKTDTGKLAWEYVVPASVTKKLAPPASTEIYSAPLVVHGTLYLLSDDGTLSALQPGILSPLPPRVTVMVPTPGSTVSGTGIVPSATLADEGAGIDPTTVSLMLDGQPVSGIIFDAYKDQVTKPVTQQSATGLGRLDDGAHELVVHASDWYGNSVTHSWGFFVDNSQAAQNGNGNQPQF